MSKRFYLLFLCLAINGCDSFPGPVIRNGYETQIHVTRKLMDGRVGKTGLIPCEELHLELYDGPGGRIELVTISVDGEIVYQLATAELERLKSLQDGAKKYSVWSISSEGIHQTYERQTKECIARIESRNMRVRKKADN